MADFCWGSDLVSKRKKRQLSNNSPASFPLSEVQVGETVRAIAIEDLDESSRLLASQGLKPGLELRVESRTKSGSVTVIIGDNLLGLGAVISRNSRVSFSNEDKP